MDNLSLVQLGWQPFFQQQLALEEWESTIPARVVEYHKNAIELLCQEGTVSIPIVLSLPEITVGDWLLLDSDKQFYRLLNRTSCFYRLAAGREPKQQLIGANVNTAFVICSLNEDFNLNRIERYLALVHESGAEPVIILSKSDICSAPDVYVAKVQGLDSQLCVLALNCLDADDCLRVDPWTKEGDTIVMLGSSGVGKSTLINTLSGCAVQKTAEIRESDDKGRHTTTRRSLISLPSGAMILDTPGIRELKLVECSAGISSTFSDIESLSYDCRFGDCTHNMEPGCAVRKAIDCGELDNRRLANYQKLLREQKLNSANLAEKRARDKQLGKYYKRVQQESVHRKRG